MNENNPIPENISETRATRVLKAAQFQTLADVPPEVEWFANIEGFRPNPGILKVPRLNQNESAKIMMKRVNGFAEDSVR